MATKKLHLLGHGTMNIDRANHIGKVCLWNNLIFQLLCILGDVVLVMLLHSGISRLITSDPYRNNT